MELRGLVSGATAATGGNQEKEEGFKHHLDSALTFEPVCPITRTWIHLFKLFLVIIAHPVFKHMVFHLSLRPDVNKHH